MSGGYFDYEQFKVQNLYDEVKDIDLDDETWLEVDDKVREDISRLKLILNEAYTRLEILDLYLCSDIGLETYHARLEENLK